MYIVGIATIVKASVICKEIVQCQEDFKDPFNTKEGVVEVEADLLEEQEIQEEGEGEEIDHVVMNALSFVQSFVQA